VRLKEVDRCGVTETIITTVTNPNTPDANICIGHIFGPFTWNFAQRPYYVEGDAHARQSAIQPHLVPVSGRPLHGADTGVMRL
jgi:hypothetical protein